jgi:hypothetical protein
VRRIFFGLKLRLPIPAIYLLNPLNRLVCCFREQLFFSVKVDFSTNAQRCTTLTHALVVTKFPVFHATRIFIAVLKQPATLRQINPKGTIILLLQPLKFWENSAKHLSV